MSNLSQIVKEIDGVQFYTDVATGKSGVSQNGLAVLCGVDEKSVRNALNSIRTSKPYKGLECFLHKSLEVRTQTQSGMWLCNDELCVALIRYYDRKGNETAQFTFDKFAVIGFNTWVQSITGWDSEIKSSQPVPQPVLLSTTSEQLAGLIKEANQKLLMLYRSRTVTYKKDKDGLVKMTVYKNRVKEYETYISDKSAPSLVNPQILIIGHYDPRSTACTIDIDSPLKEAYVRWRDYDHICDRDWTRDELEEWIRVNFPVK